MNNDSTRINDSTDRRLVNDPGRDISIVRFDRCGSSIPRVLTELLARHHGDADHRRVEDRAVLVLLTMIVPMVASEGTNAELHASRTTARARLPGPPMTTHRLWHSTWMGKVDGWMGGWIDGSMDRRREASEDARARFLHFQSSSSTLSQIRSSSE